MKLRSAAGPALLLAGLGALVLVLSPFHNTPVQDDWDYARTVLLLLRIGTFQRSEIAQATEVFSALWGGAFAALLGFTFDALRLSTLVLSAASLLLLYALLGELGFRGARRMAGAATMLACPLFVFLSFSFMTDVPALACLLAALYFYVRALQHGKLRFAFAGSVFVSLAFLTRQVGLVSGLAAASYFLVRPPSHSTAAKFVWAGRVPAGGKAEAESGAPPDIRTANATSAVMPWLVAYRLGWVAASAVLPVVVAIAYFFWLSQTGGLTWANSQLTVGGTLQFVRDPQTAAVLLRRIIEDCMTLAVYLLPLWLLVLPGLRRLRTAARPGRWMMLSAALVAALFIVTTVRLAQRGEYLPYLTDVVTRQGLRPYLAYFAYAGGAFRPDILPLPFWMALTALGVVGGWGFAILVLRRFSRAGGSQVSKLLSRPVANKEPYTGRPTDDGPGQTDKPGVSLIYWSTFCFAIPTLLFPEFYERFLLPFLPAAIILLLDTFRRINIAPNRHAYRAGATLAAAGVLTLAVCSILLMKDYWGWMDLRWPVAQSIVEAGVPLRQLDGGYEWDGWNLYEPSMELIRQNKLSMQITPWAYVIDPQYMLAFAPLAGYSVAREVRFESPFGAAAGRFYVLQRNQ